MSGRSFIRPIGPNSERRGSGVGRDCRRVASLPWSDPIVCGRFTLISSVSELQLRFGFAVESAESQPRYNIAPTQPVLTVVNDGNRRGELMRWGLVPSWAKDVKIGSRMINAVSETAATKPAFRSAFRRRRCLVLADGFFEWRREGKRRVPLYFFQRSGEPMAFAGLWENWQAPEGEWIRSCTILTTAANTFIEPVHNRMPVILSVETEPLWLDPLTETPANLEPLLVPVPSDLLDVREVSPMVNSARSEGPGCIAPPAPPEEVRLFS